MVDAAAAERLKLARKRRFESGRQAASALGVSPDTYLQYENGLRGFARHARRFSEFYRVNLEWLLTGRGPMDGRRAAAEIAIHGVVGAGSTILPIDDDAAAIQIGDIQLPSSDEIGAVIIKGDSGYPRFQDGETLIFYTKPRRPDDLLNRQAIVQTKDGRRLIKTLRPTRSPPGSPRFLLESFNSPPEIDVDVLCAWEIYGLLFR